MAIKRFTDAIVILIRELFLSRTYIVCCNMLRRVETVLYNDKHLSREVGIGGHVTNLQGSVVRSYQARGPILFRVVVHM